MIRLRSSQLNTLTVGLNADWDRSPRFVLLCCAFARQTCSTRMPSIVYITRWRQLHMSIVARRCAKQSIINPWCEHKRRQALRRDSCTSIARATLLLTRIVAALW